MGCAMGSSAAAAGSPRSQSGHRSLAVGSPRDGGKSAAASPCSTLTPRSQDGLHSPGSMAGDDDDDNDYDPRDARFVRQASDSSIAESRRKILEDQIARLGAAVRSRRAQGESSSALVHYETVLQDVVFTEVDW